MFFPGEKPPRRLAALLLALACAGGLLALLALWVVPGPAVVEASQGPARIAFQADRRFVNRPGDCLTLSWEASAIQAIYLNGEGQAGEGTTTVCLQGNVMQRLEVVFEDGSQQTYFLPTGILPWQAEFWLVLGTALVGLFILGRSTVGPLRRRTRLSAWIILLGATATLGLTLVIAVLHPRPTAAGLIAGDARISLDSDQDWVLRPTDCVTLTWRLDHIQAVYLNGTGIPGTGSEPFCFRQGSPDLRVTLPDGSDIHHGLTVHVLLGRSGLTVLAVCLLLLGGLAAGLGFGWARHVFVRAGQPFRTPAGRRQLMQIGLVVWIGVALFVYWIMVGAPGLTALQELYTALYRVLIPLFYAPYQG